MIYFENDFFNAVDNLIGTQIKTKFQRNKSLITLYQTTESGVKIVILLILYKIRNFPKVYISTASGFLTLISTSTAVQDGSKSQIVFFAFNFAQ
jgi:hypothetical protein